MAACKHCGCGFIPRRGLRGPASVHCSDECRRAFSAERTRLAYHDSKDRLHGNAWKIEYRNCVECGCVIIGARSRRGVLCQKSACRKANRDKSLRRETQCKCRHCGADFTGTVPNAVFCSRQCANSRNNSARIARKRLVETEFVSVRVLHERDGGRCQLCHKAVDLSLPWPDRKSATIDHIIPLSKGGADTYKNTQLAHLSCNSRKSNRMEGKQLLLIG